MSDSHTIYEEIRGTDSNGDKNDKDGVDRTYEYKLGSDDPFWMEYLEEAEKYDDVKIRQWDKKMETLLLFATLFSAIVTAFVIEASQNLQPDHAAITAKALVEIAGMLRNRTADTLQDLSELESPDKFQPTSRAFLVNFAWFISLCLSITVALLAGLVKQWCNALLSDRIAPPCNQARIRQARFNKLIRWRTELVISTLPMIMDVALGLFLLGLLEFLRDLHFTIYLAALIVILITVALYFSTTLAPCFVSFCPYETAFSSRKAWGFYYNICLATINWVCKKTQVNFIIEADLTNYMPPCEKKEIDLTSNTAPDWLTGDALNWAILHSQKSKPREKAIRAIATLESKNALERLVSGPPEILPQVIQSFTSCFVVHKREDNIVRFGFKKSIDFQKASLHGQALAVLITNILLSSNLEERQVREPSIHSKIETGVTHSKWVVDVTTKESVKARFKIMASGQNPNPEARVWGVVGLSVWYDFIGYDTGLRFNQGKAVCKLAESLNWSLSPSLLKEVLRTLTKEITHWAPDINSNYRDSILSRLINLVPNAPFSEKPQFACALAVLSLNLNHGTSYPLSSASNYPPYPEMRHGDKLAEALMGYYATKPEELAEDGGSILLFALTGLMEYYEHCDFDKEAHQNVEKIAEQLQALDNLGNPRSIKLKLNTRGSPRIVLVDPRAYFVNILLLYLKSPLNQHMDKVFTSLLKAVNPKRQSWELAAHGPQIIPLVAQILVQTTDTELQTQCLGTILSYWSSGPSLLYSRMLLFYEVPHKLFHITRNLVHEDQDLAAGLLLEQISLVFQKMGELEKHLVSTRDNEKLALCIDKAICNDLLEVLVYSVRGPDKFRDPQMQLNDSNIKPESSTEVHPLESVCISLTRSASTSESKSGLGESLLKRMIEAYIESQKGAPENPLANDIAERLLGHLALAKSKDQITNPHTTDLSVPDKVTHDTPTASKG